MKSVRKNQKERMTEEELIAHKYRLARQKSRQEKLEEGEEDENYDSEEEKDILDYDFDMSEISQDEDGSYDSELSLQRRLEEEKREESFGTYETWLSHIWSTEDLFEKYRKIE